MFAQGAFGMQLGVQLFLCRQEQNCDDNAETMCCIPQIVAETWPPDSDNIYYEVTGLQAAVDQDLRLIFVLYLQPSRGQVCASLQASPAQRAELQKIRGLKGKMEAELASLSQRMAAVQADPSGPADGSRDQVSCVSRLLAVLSFHPCCMHMAEKVQAGAWPSKLL